MQHLFKTIHVLHLLCKSFDLRGVASASRIGYSFVLPETTSFCRKQLRSARNSFVLPETTSFCRKQLRFAGNSFVLPETTSFRRKQLRFAGNNFVLLETASFWRDQSGALEGGMKSVSGNIQGTAGN